MGRWTTGAITTGQCLQLPISSITYGNGASIGFSFVKKMGFSF